MACGVRYFVVFMTFMGMLIYVGLRAVYSMVVTHIIHNGTWHKEESTFNIKCCNNSNVNFYQDWKTDFPFTSQLVYYIGTILTQLPGGILAAKFAPRRVSGVAMLITSLLCIACVFALQYKAWLVYVIRFLQGLIEGPIVPACNGVLAPWAPNSEKSTLITIAYAGAYLSTAVADYVSGIMICRVSWGSALYLYGGLGIIWAILWLCLVYDTPHECPWLGKQEKELFQLEESSTFFRPDFNTIPWCKILTSVPLSAVLVAAFCRNLIFALLICGLPVYFKNVFPKMNSAELGFWCALPHILMTVVVIPGGKFIDCIIKKKWLSTTAARKMAETIGFGVEAGCLLTMGLVHSSDKYVTITLLCAGVGISGMAISGYQVNPLDLAPQYASVLTGIVRVGTLGAVIAMVLAEELPGKTQSRTAWQNLFISAAVIHLAGVLYYLIFASGNRQTWAEVDEDKILRGVADHAESLTDKENMYKDDDKASLLTKSVRIERLISDEKQYEGPSWFLNTV